MTFSMNQISRNYNAFSFKLLSKNTKVDTLTNVLIISSNIGGALSI
ncbi:hypothetical protein SAMN06269250_3393 [Spirosoma fluviale]|uniref:Uncharacterized protein n=1 Tax=Spirosoma fluviale TaxID=1597977 RepID=A0A286G4B6_9BACT|nr:hypothetical protein SAMN06269250_3393 [Spirosoma fluviale]